ncbi:DUF3231 family protein [Bacillus piscicola]|uniref:DUF3231 family protein n=1 Tax=Bacillus piscicola TaxID=1632684 RepID=UPI001F0994EF|nr:DUF3231 family protein [Bacillus piscicola]
MGHNPDITASELGNLWNSYMSDSMNRCVMKHFLAHCKEPATKEVIQHAKELSENHLASIAAIFEKENIPIPQGYSDADVNDNAPQLFSETFCLRYLQCMGRTGTNINGMALGTAYREDVKDFYLSIVKESAKLYDTIVELMKKQGILVRTPYIPYSKQVEFVQDEHFLKGHLTRNKRPLLAIEIANISNNIEMNVIARALFVGLAQAAESQEVRKHLQEGMVVCTEIIKTFEEMLDENGTDTPFSSDSIVTESTVAPFSDKLIMGLNAALASLAIGNFGQGITGSLRSDIISEYSQLSARVGKYANAGSKIAIKNGWLEKPPQSLDRKKLQNQR